MKAWTVANSTASINSMRSDTAITTMKPIDWHRLASENHHAAHDQWHGVRLVP
jgi:hypothetical protein